MGWRRLLSAVVGAERIGIMVARITVIQIGGGSVAYLAGACGSPLVPISRSSPSRDRLRPEWCYSSAQAAAAASRTSVHPRAFASDGLLVEEYVKVGGTSAFP
jgi:hypothetical protein